LFKSREVCANKKFFVTNLRLSRLPSIHPSEDFSELKVKVMTHSHFLQQVLPFKDRVYRFAKRMLISSDEAEDATQEILMKLWANHRQLGKYRNLEAFAMTMTRNFCLDRLKSKEASNLELVHSNYTDTSSGLARSLEVRDSVSWIERIMQNLPEQQRMVLQLRDIEAYEYEEIAEIMQMQPTAVRVALSRARKAVREKLIQKHEYGLS
jgi:RNA polymerase sigma factor (sigma-70 family)